jgi:D-sedoheptulose 7-phosphate isomerase
LKAKDYFQILADLMLSIQATDGNSSVVDLEKGTEQAVQMILDAEASSRKVMITGNGGSATIASHVHADLYKGVGVKSLVFSEQALLTALANDDGYGSVYEGPVRQWSQTGDLLITLSSSGGSENILRAATSAKELGCRVITLTGFKPDNPSRKLGDLNFYVDSSEYGFVETAHAALTHYLTDQARLTVRGASHHHHESD